MLFVAFWLITAILVATRAPHSVSLRAEDSLLHWEDSAFSERLQRSMLELVSHCSTKRSCGSVRRREVGAPNPREEREKKATAMQK